MGEGEVVKKLFLFLAVISLFTGGVATTAFADGDDDDDDGGNNKPPPTLESECEKQLNKKKINIAGLFCLAIFALEDTIDMIKGDIEMIKDDVSMIDTDLGSVESDVSMIKDDTGMIKSDVGMVKTDVGMVKDDTGMIKSDVGMIKSDVSDIEDAILNSQSGLVRIVTEIDDGDDNQYEGTVTYDRTSGSGIFLIERLHVCDLDIGQNTGTDELEIDIKVDGNFIENPTGAASAKLSKYKSGPFTEDAGCVDLLYATTYGESVGPLPGSLSRDVEIKFTETDFDNQDNDGDGARIIAYISGLADASEMTVTENLD